jgi:hypothetical protein
MDKNSEFLSSLSGRLHTANRAVMLEKKKEQD